MEVYGGSMLPILSDGQWLLIRKIKYYQRDQIIVFKVNGKLMIKIIVGLPGDIITINGKTLRINNQIYTNYFSSTQLSIEISLDSNQLFVIGENQDLSIDSRKFGPIDISTVIGSPVISVWPLQRIGKPRYQIMST
ncbi:MAG: signal peptidase I [Candidatus Heimdallarchaeota archaeon]|nr:signal peptidase I [Candidatus Heimdallarchaeota archaeon]